MVTACFAAWSMVWCKRVAHGWAAFSQRPFHTFSVLLTISSGSSGRGLIPGLMPGLISSLTSLGKIPLLQVRVKEAGKHFLHHHRPELEFSAWTSLFLGSFCAHILCLCLGKQQSWNSFSYQSGCREDGGEGEEAHRASLPGYID